MDPRLAMPDEPDEDERLDGDSGDGIEEGLEDGIADEPDPAEDLVAPEVVRETERGDGPEADLVVTPVDRDESAADAGTTDAGTTAADAADAGSGRESGGSRSA